MTTEHKHAEVLRAIADGKTVQWKSYKGEWFDALCDTGLNPLVGHSFEWRVKPEPKPDVVRYDFVRKSCFLTLEEARREAPSYGGGIVRSTFDGETGKLKSVEIVE